MELIIKASGYRKIKKFRSNREVKMKEITDFFENNIEPLVRDSERLQIIMDYVKENEILDRRALIAILGISEKQKFHFK